MTKRMVYSETWKDSFVGGLPFLERLLWVGLITLADDQGRIENDPTIIRSDIFPRDTNVKDQAIESAIGKFEQAGKVVVYEADGKALLQIVNWWEYQALSWPSSSRYPAPPGWTDRVNEHIPGGGIRKMNWDKKGGFAKGPGCDQVSGMDGGILEAYKPIDEIRGDEIRGDESRQASSLACGKYDNDFSILSQAFTDETGLTCGPESESKWHEAEAGMLKAGVTPDDVRQAIREVQAKKKYTIVGLQSVTLPAMMSRARRQAAESTGRVLYGPNGERMTLS